MPTRPRYSDLKPDELTVRQPGRAVMLALIALGIVMLVLAALSSERVTAPSQRHPEAARAASIETAPGAER